MKEAGTTFWESPNSGATNESGFSALPGGVRTHDWEFEDIGHSSYFWSSDEDEIYYGWQRNLDHDSVDVSFLRRGKSQACSIRCVKD